MESKSAEIYEFGEFRVETADKTLWRGDGKIALPIKAVEVLAVLIENRGRTVSKEELMEKVWPETFVDENNLAVMISKLRKAFGSDSKIIDTIPRRGYRFTATLFTPEPRELVIERVTDETLSREIKVERVNGAMPYVAAGLLAGVLFVGGVVGVYWFARPDRVGERAPATTAVISDNSVAVTPFANLTKKESDDALAVGLADVLITRLSTVPGIAIVSTPSNAANVLEGSVQRSGNKLRVSYKIVRKADQSVRFADTVDVDDSNLLEVQERISHGVLDTLLSSLTAGDRELFTKRETTSEKAYELYLNGNYALSKRSLYDIKTSIGLFEESSKLDNQFALPLVGIARAYMILGDSALGEIPPREAAEKARPYLDRALALRPNLAEVLSILGTIRLNYDWNIEAAEELLARAIAINPNISQPRYQLAWLRIAKSDYDGADREFREARRVDPTAQILQTEHGYAKFFGGDFEGAAQLFREAVDRDPKAPTARFNYWRVLHQFGRLDEETTELEVLRAMTGGTYALFKFCDARTAKVRGDFATADRIYAELAADRSFSPLFMAILAAEMDRADDLFMYLDRSFDERNDYLLHLHHAPEFAKYRDDPRFVALRRKVADAKR